MKIGLKKNGIHLYVFGNQQDKINSNNNFFSEIVIIFIFNVMLLFLPGELVSFKKDVKYYLNERIEEWAVGMLIERISMPQLYTALHNYGEWRILYGKECIICPEHPNWLKKLST